MDKIDEFLESKDSIDSFLDEKKPVEKKSIGSKMWEALGYPKEKSKQILKGLEKKVSEKISSPGGMTGDITSDAMIGGLIGTAAEIVPEYVSRESILTAGALGGAKALAPVARPIGRFIGKTAEEISGLNYKVPGVLKETFNDPFLLFAKGKESARKLYEAAKGGTPQIREELSGLMTKQDFVQKALDLAKKGELTAFEALEARKELNTIKKSIPDEAFRKTREIFDDVAKTKFSPADTAYSRAVKAEEMRRILPINKGGTPSLAKGAAMVISKTPLAAFASPAVQGSIAAGLGTAAKLTQSPVATSMIPGTYTLLDRLYKNREKQ